MRGLAARNPDSDVLFASKAFPCTAVYRVLAEEGLACDVASGGELALALRGGFDPARIYLHGNAKSEAELGFALEAGVGHIVLDSLHDVERLEQVRGRAGATQDVLIRITPERLRRHPRRDLDRPGRLEVRLRAGRGAGRDRSGRRLAAPEARRAALPHRLAAARARAVHARGGGARDAR